MLFAAVSSAAVAGAIDGLSHVPRDMDCLHPGISASPLAITSVDYESRTVKFNPEFFSNETSEADIYIKGDTVSYIQFATKHRFLLNSDTLSYMGFENRGTLFSVDGAFAAVRLDLTEGDTIKGRWTGRATGYGNAVLRAMSGRSASHAGRGWTLVADGDTLRGATRVIWDLDTEYVNPDSIPEGTADSIAADAVSALIVDVGRLMSERLLTRREMWFADGARYPVLQRSSVSRVLMNKDTDGRDTVPVSMTAMYYPALWQYSDTGEEPRKAPAGESRDIRRASSDDVESDLRAGEPVTDGEAVTLTVSSANGGKDATVTLYSDSGLRLTEPVTVTLTNIPRTISIPVPAGWKGVLLIRLEAGQDSLTRKTVI